MASITAYLVPDYANSVSIAGATGTLITPGVAGGTASGPITFGKRRILHISAINTTGTTNRCAVNYTLGLSSGTTAPTPVITSPFFLGDEGWTIDLGDSYDQINLAVFQQNDGTTQTIAYSISVMSKF